MAIAASSAAFHVCAALLLCVLSQVARASWLSDITGVDVNVPANTIKFGPPRPERIPIMLENLPKDAATFFLNPAGGVLALAIRQAKENAKRVCIPMPQQVVVTLAPYFPLEVMNGVCWAVVRDGYTLDAYAIRDGGMAAITLEDVVIFRTSQDGFSPVLWAHELAHVLQYRRLGIEGFAALYTVAWDSLEQEARNYDQFVTRNLQNANSSRYWSTANDWNPNQQIAREQYARYSRQALSPTTCSRYQDVSAPADWPAGTTLNYTEVINSCPIPITVVSVTLQTIGVSITW